jgi:hypothetical protein
MIELQTVIAYVIDHWVGVAGLATSAVTLFYLVKVRQSQVRSRDASTMVTLTQLNEKLSELSGRQEAKNDELTTQLEAERCAREAASASVTTLQSKLARFTSMLERPLAVKFTFTLADEPQILDASIEFVAQSVAAAVADATETR